MAEEIKRLTFEFLEPYIKKAIAQGWTLSTGFFVDSTEKRCCPVFTFDLDPARSAETGRLTTAVKLGFEEKYLWGFIYAFDGSPKYGVRPHSLGNKDGAAVREACFKAGYLK